MGEEFVEEDGGGVVLGRWGVVWWMLVGRMETQTGVKVHTSFPQTSNPGR